MKHAKRILRMAAPYVIMAILMLMFYYAAIHPMISKLFWGSIKHSGVHLFEEKTYLEFDNGEVFERVMDDIKLPEDSRIVEFYYFDNKRRDNPFYGKMVDAFAIDVLMPESYDIFKNKLTDHGKDLGSIHSSYSSEIYWMTEAVNSTTDNLFIAFRDEVMMIRFILLTDYEYDPSTDFAPTLITHQTGLDW